MNISLFINNDTKQQNENPIPTKYLIGYMAARFFAGAYHYRK